MYFKHINYNYITCKFHSNVGVSYILSNAQKSAINILANLMKFNDIHSHKMTSVGWVGLSWVGLGWVRGVWLVFWMCLEPCVRLSPYPIFHLICIKHNYITCTCM